MASMDEDDFDDEWKPPTDAELKVINARRERSDKISKKMGEYMLKGHKMLATCCPVCTTIEMQDRQGKVYCIACTEIDNDENAKDNPLLNRDAATRTLAESAERRQDRPQASSSGTPLTQLPPGNPTSSARSTSESAAAIMARLQPPSSAAGAEGGGGHHEVAKVAVNDSLDVVVRKLRGVTQALAATDNVEQSRDYVTLIKECADAIISLRKADQQS